MQEGLRSVVKEIIVGWGVEYYGSRKVGHVFQGSNSDRSVLSQGQSKVDEALRDRI